MMSAKHNVKGVANIMSKMFFKVKKLIRSNNQSRILTVQWKKLVSTIGSDANFHKKKLLTGKTGQHQKNVNNSNYRVKLAQNIINNYLDLMLLVVQSF